MQPPCQAMETPEPLRLHLCVRDILNPAGDADEKLRDSLKSQPWELPARLPQGESDVCSPQIDLDTPAMDRVWRLES